MPTASVEAAIVARLKAVSAVNTPAGGRVYATTNTVDAPLPLVVVTKTGATGSTPLDGGRALKRYSVTVDCYAATETAAETLGAAVRDALAPTGGTPWQDAGLGVSGVIFEDSTAAATEEGWRVQTEAFGVWFSPTT